MSDIEMTEEEDFSHDEEGEEEEDSLSPYSHQGFDESEVDYLEESEGLYSTIIPEKNVKKNYEVAFKSFTGTDLIAAQQAEVLHVSNILGMKSELSSILLRYFKWNKEKLIETYMENDAEVSQKAGLPVDGENAKIHRTLIAVQGFSCDICCNDEPDLLTYSLACNDRFCQDCYKQYLTIKIAEDGESRYLTCPGSSCKLVIDEKTVEKLVDAPIFQKYQMLLLKTFVDDKIHLKWCPSPNCENAVECKVTAAQLTEIVPTVECISNHKFCFGCSLPSDHQPATCEVSKMWLKKCADDSETANWIAANTKECPKCNSTIEKNGGCNHMTCKKCKYEFCWICHGNWAEHGTAWYTCNRYEEKDSINARDAQAKSRAALERYLHYYNRYANHDQSAKLDKDLFEKTERKMEAMQQTSEFSWIQVQFLKSAVQVLLQSRQTLMWTYCLAFFLSRSSNATALFEDNQRDLEMAVEGLSGLLETEITAENASETRKLVLDKTEYVNRRRQVLLSDTAAGHLEHRWVYTSPE